MEIAKRQLNLKRYTARDYNQDGLIGLWDGIENAGWNMHDSNATVWKNLAEDYEDNNWTVSSHGAWRDNGLRSDGKGYAASGVKLSSFMTLEFVFRVDGSVSNVCLMTTGKTGYNGFTYFYSPGSKNNNSLSFGRIYCFSTPTHVAGQSHHMAFTNTSLTATSGGSGFHNGLRLDQSEYFASDYMNEGVGTPTLFGRIGGDRNTVGTVFCIRAYDRILSDKEIMTNYLVDKERFGI